jgi:hypothetical protein
MALVKPLVISVGGQVQRLQAGDTLDVPALSGGDVISLTNDEAGAVVIGAPVYSDATSGFKKGKADASGTKTIIGLVAQTSITNGVAGNIQLNGPLAATTGQWDAVTGQVGGLTFNTKYYLSAATAGLLTTTPPSTAGQYVCEVGTALSTTVMNIRIQEDILL